MALKVLLLALLGSVRLALAACPALPNPLPAAASLPEIAALPNPWTFFNGQPLNSTEDWACRRAELKTLVQNYLYGFYPNASAETVTARRSGNTISISVSAGGKTGSFSTTLTLPSGASPSNPAPVLISAGSTDNNVFIPNGVAVAVFDTNSVAADSNSKTGAFWSIYNGQDIGVLLAWGWGFHRILDAIIQVAPEIDSKRVAVTGCSRWGKGALVAGIFDERITLTMPMSSGLEGVGPWRYTSGENISNIFQGAPWWVTSKLGGFVSNVRKLPFDAHLQTALVAPRPLIWDIGQQDTATYAQGAVSVTYVATHAIYSWLGVGDKNGIAIRNSGHCDPSGYSNVRDFMLKTFFNRTITRDYTNISPYQQMPQAYPWLNSAPR